jgi:hypothetical protein
VNALEQQLASLLTEAPGEPPTVIDPDALLSHASRRRRFLAPALAAAAVVALAIPIAAVVMRDNGSPPTRSTAPGTEAPAPQPSTTSDPKGDAVARITAALDAAPLPPGAVRSDSALEPVREPFSTSGAGNQVRRTAWWTAPGEVDATIAFLKAHPPTGMTLQGWGSGSAGKAEVDFADSPASPAAYPLEIDYYAAPYDRGIALRVDAWTSWAPNRPGWSFVPADATSVDLSVVRDAYNPGLGGAPAVRRTLTGDDLTRLADALNALPPRAPEGVHSCPAILVRASEVAVFHTAHGDVRMEHKGGGCAFNATITAPPDPDEVYVDGGDFTDLVLTALGLPRNYGFGR